jgi:hypothetical protein
MERHAVADVQVHSTLELSSILGVEITGREQLRVWPLSSVELLTGADGSRVVYKAQRMLTVEPAFYRAAGAVPILPACRVLTEGADSSTMILEYLDRPWTFDSSTEGAVVRAARTVVDTVGTLSARLPAFVEIDTVDRWAEELGWTLNGLSELIGDRRFQRCTNADVEFVAVWSKVPAVLDAIIETSRLTSGDLKFEQVFEGSDGLRLVDWQVPVRGPADIDLVMLLNDRNVPALEYVAPAVVGIRWFLLLRWAVYAKLMLIPTMPRLFDQWAADAILAIRAAAAQEK